MASGPKGHDKPTYGILKPTLAPSLRHLRPPLSLPRLLRPTLCLLSLALCVALGGLGVRSYWIGYHINHEGPSGGYDAALVIADGRVLASWNHPERLRDGWGWLPYPHPDRDDYPGYDGSFGLRRGAVWFPLWSPVILTAILPGLWVYRRMTGGGAGSEGRQGFPVETSGEAVPTTKENILPPAC